MHTAVTRFNTVVLLDRTHIGPPAPNPSPTPPASATTAPPIPSSSTPKPTSSAPSPSSPTPGAPPASSSPTAPSSRPAETSMVFTKFAPCEPDSVCDWELLQDVQLHRVRGRRYATNQILPDGSFIIIRGKAVSSIEFFPPQKEIGLVDFSFFNQVEDNQMDNLYPYVH
ncbi:hypothetical protein SASPL_111861 [Salvia splendens]|uniref:Glyoxal oxidase N-terminal domain-containing protein n=1 Tax=Salvia splendens TaxID=180675 RepID=A0A8X8Y8W5_SALSN|nr:hypothetical protein SASPL_111861 [Salvia splendens]